MYHRIRYDLSGSQSMPFKIHPSANDSENVAVEALTTVISSSFFTVLD